MVLVLITRERVLREGIESSGLSIGQVKVLPGVQDVLPQNVPTWHTEYFKLKEFEKTAGAGRSV